MAVGRKDFKMAEDKERTPQQDSQLMVDALQFERAGYVARIARSDDDVLTKRLEDRIKQVDDQLKQHGHKAKETAVAKGKEQA